MLCGLFLFVLCKTMETSCNLLLCELHEEDSANTATGNSRVVVSEAKIKKKKMRAQV